MIPFSYLFAIGLSLFGIGLAGIASERHLVVILLSVEIMLASSTIILVGFFTFANNANPSALIMLVSIWAVAAAEIIALITFYVYMKGKGISFDVSRLSKFKW